jgi:hypothetical protein
MDMKWMRMEENGVERNRMKYDIFYFDFIKCDIFFLVCKRILFDFIAYIYDSGSVQQPEEANAACGV